MLVFRGDSFTMRLGRKESWKSNLSGRHGDMSPSERFRPLGLPTLPQTTREGWGNQVLGPALGNKNEF